MSVDTPAWVRDARPSLVSTAVSVATGSAITSSARTMWNRPGYFSASSVAKYWFNVQQSM